MTTALENNRRTVESYQRIARSYADSTAPSTADQGRPGLRRLVELVPPGGQVLEIGSGPGWQADLVESHGPQVRRTDVTDAFLDLQRERGKQVERLDVINDDLGGPYDAVMALCVLQHIDRRLTAPVLAKIANALEPGGVFLVSVREGTGELWEGTYHTVLWEHAAFDAALTAAGLRTDWMERTAYSKESWLTFLARTA